MALSKFVRGLVRGFWSKTVARFLESQDRNKIEYYIQNNVDLSENFYNCFANAIKGRYNLLYFDKLVQKVSVNEILEHLTLENVYKALHETKERHDLIDIFNTYRARVWIDEMVKRVKILILSNFAR